MPEAAQGTPFGPRVHAVAAYLKTFQALSDERLQGAFADLFGLRLSQGGLMNMLRRAQGAFAAARDKAVAALRRATVVASDETGVRVEASNAYHWVFRCSEAVVHRAAPTRGAIVVRTLMGGHRPAVWCSDRYAAQQGHAAAHQTCLAHLARDVASADEASEDVVATFAASTLARKRRALERSLDDILAAPTSCDLARDIQRKFRRARDQLLTFTRWPGMVEATNNACERALRPAVIQRKVTNGYRAMWAAEGEADIRTVVDTARLGPGTNAFKTILQTVSA
jgi:transposase